LQTTDRAEHFEECPSRRCASRGRRGNVFRNCLQSIDRNLFQIRRQINRLPIAAIPSPGAVGSPSAIAANAALASAARALVPLAARRNRGSRAFALVTAAPTPPCEGHAATPCTASRLHRSPVARETQRHCRRPLPGEKSPNAVRRAAIAGPITAETVRRYGARQTGRFLMPTRLARLPRRRNAVSRVPRAPPERFQECPATTPAGTRQNAPTGFPVALASIVGWITPFRTMPIGLEPIQKRLQPFFARDYSAPGRRGGTACCRAPLLNHATPGKISCTQR